MKSPTINPDALLVRALGVRQLAAAIFNYTVGSGILVLPAFAVAQLGAAAPLAYFACMIVMALMLFCFAEAGSRVSMTGGPYAYVETALGPVVGFIAGVRLYLTSALAPSGEMRSPSHTVPAAAFIALTAATLLYLCFRPG